MKNIQAISLSELDEHSKGSLWVINSADKSKWRLRGDVSISIPSLNGAKDDGLVIRQSWLPVDAAQYIPRDRLLQATQFRRAVIEGLITVISRDDAERLLSQKGAFEERMRLEQREMSVRDAAKPRSIKDSNVEMTLTGADRTEDDDEATVQIYGEETLAKAAKRGIELDDDGLEPSFKMFADRLIDESDMNALNALRARGRFTRRELRYLAKVLTDHPETQKKINAGLRK
jgi:hypothetical protein